MSGIDTYPTTGRLDMTVVASTPADARLSLPQALLSYWLPYRDALPRASVYDPGKSVEQVQHEDADRMETAQDDAVVAALRADGQTVIARPAVYSVTIGGPAHQRLLPGDLVTAVDGVAARTEKNVRDGIQRHEAGETVIFTVIRAKQQQRVKVITAESTTQSDVPVVGITLGTGYDYAPDISFDFGQQIGGPSAGLVFALAIYDKITAGALLGGRHVAGTGHDHPDRRRGPHRGHSGEDRRCGEGRRDRVLRAGRQLRRPGRAAYRRPPDQGEHAPGCDRGPADLEHSRGDRPTAELLMSQLSVGDPDALVAALVELDTYVGRDGWDARPRLFALVLRDVLAAAEPQLSAELPAGAGVGRG